MATATVLDRIFDPLGKVLTPVPWTKFRVEHISIIARDQIGAVQRFVPGTAHYPG